MGHQREVPQDFIVAQEECQHGLLDGLCFRGTMFRFPKSPRSGHYLFF